MKKIHGLLLSLCRALMPTLQSCDDDDEGYSVGDFTPPLWATVRTTGNAFYLDCDVWGTLWPVNVDLGWYEAVDGQRVITVFNPLSDEYAGYDHAVKILSMTEVLTKSVEVLTPENEEEFGNDPLLIYKGDIGVSGGYLNLFFYQILPKDDTKHRISLVRPQDDAEYYDEEGYIHLQLRYNDYDNLSGYRNPYPSIVSFSLQSLDIPSEAKGMKLTLNSEVNGEVELTCDFSTPQAVTVPDNFEQKSLEEVQLR